MNKLNGSAKIKQSVGNSATAHTLARYLSAEKTDTTFLEIIEDEIY